jgi:putative flavoprotein involved in K+ transport
MQEHHDTIVIGGGQAGLAMSAVLQQRGREHVVLERQRVGERWRTERWASLRFQFPNWSLELPGYAYSGEDPDGFAHWRKIVRLLEDYAASIRAPMLEHTEVTRLRADDGGFVLSVPDGTIHARHVVIATGPFQRPRIPQLSEGVPPSVLQTDPTRYRRPDDLPDGAVLVVGTGASGIQISDELLNAGRTVFLSVSRHRRVPRRFRDKDVYWWLDRMGRFEQTIDSFPGRRWPPHTAVTGVSGGYDINVRRMAAAGLQVTGRVIGASDGTLSIAQNANEILDEADNAFAAFLDAAQEYAAAHSEIDPPDEEPTGSDPLPASVAEISSLDLGRENITAIVWATGYDYDYDWMHVPVLDVHGRPLQERGVTRVPGLYFLGLHWMHTFKSGLLAGVGSDAEYLAEHMDLMTGR